MGCPYATGHTSCTTSQCFQPVDCVGAWGQYDACGYSEADHENERCRLYEVSQPALNNGYACPHEDKLKHCTKSGCGQPVDCEGEWDVYTECSYAGFASLDVVEDIEEILIPLPEIEEDSSPFKEDKDLKVPEDDLHPIDHLAELQNRRSLLQNVHKNKRCRTYRVTTVADLSGKQCPHKDGKIECTVEGCSQPVDCVGDWGMYGNCFHDAADHVNRRCRTYKITTSVAHNGYGCPYQNAYEQCTTSGCSQPVDCVGSWGAYGSCEHVAKDNKNRRCRHFKISLNAAHNGYGCPYANAFEQCTTSGCAQPIDCVGSWGSYSECAYVGAVELDEIPKICCKALTAKCMACAAAVTEEEFCAKEENKMIFGCKEDLNVPKDDLHPIDHLEMIEDRRSLLQLQANHKNERCRTYTVSVKANHNGYACPHEDKLKHCTKSGCGQPVDCEGEWGLYGACSRVASTHNNERCRTYQVTTKSDLSGKQCPHKEGELECTTSMCSQPVDCVGGWGAYGTCFHDENVHKNRRCRKYAVSTVAAHNGYGCPYQNLFKQCTTEGCAQPVDCLGDWEEYGACAHDQSEHQNKRCRTYAVSQPASNNGYACPYAESYLQCTVSGCSQPVDCVGSWDEYSFCNYVADDHSNKKCRKYQVILKNAHNGYACPYSDKFEQCTNDGCAQPVDCVGTWDQYDACHYVGEGHENERCRIYKVSQPALNSGYACPHEDKLQQCTQSGCGQPVDCEGEWGPYGICSYVKNSHDNSKCRNYVVTVEADLNGKACPHKHQEEECTKSGCSQPVDCVGDWTEYTNCQYDTKNHVNKKCRTYKITTSVAHNGFGCLYANAYEQCTTEGCAQPVDCLGDWEEYGACAHDDSDHKNKKCRAYAVTRPAAHNGYACAYADSYVQCTKDGCAQPVDCVGSWDEHASCKYDTNEHKNKRCRLYKISVASAHNGLACPFTDAFEQCENDGCAQPVDCVGSWEDVSPCSYDEASGTNKKCRRFEITTVDSNNGNECAFEHNAMNCSSSGCDGPVHCVGEWSEYGECVYSSSSGLYTKCRTYNVINEAENNGKDCAYVHDFESCTTSGCEQLLPPPPPPANGTLVDGNGGDSSSSDASGQNTGEDKNADGSDVSAEGVAGEDGAPLDSATEEEEAKVSTASVSMVMVGAIVAVAVCCMMGLALVYNRRQKRKRGHAPSSVYSQVGQDSPNMFGHRQQSMLLMNPMFWQGEKEHDRYEVCWQQDVLLGKSFV